MNLVRYLLVSTCLIFTSAQASNSQDNEINLGQLAPEDTIVYFSYNSSKIATNSKYVELCKESFDQGLAQSLSKASEEDEVKFTKIKDSLKNIFGEINSIEGAFYVDIQTTTEPDQEMKTKFTLLLSLELDSVENFQKSIEELTKLVPGTAITKESDVLSQTESWKIDDTTTEEDNVDIIFPGKNKAFVCISNAPDEFKRISGQILSGSNKTGTGENTLAGSNFNKMISKYTGGITLHFNLNYIWANMGNIMQAAMQEAQGPAQMFLPLIVNVAQTICGDIGYAGFTVDLNSNTLTQKFLVDFNSKNHGILDVFNGDTKQTGVHLPDNCSFYFVSHFSYTKLWEIAQNVVDQFAPMMGSDSMDLNELIKQNTGLDAQEALVNNLSPLVLVYTLSSSKNFLPVLQLLANSPEKFLSFITGIIDTSQAMSGEEEKPYQETTTAGKKGILIPLPEEGKAITIVHDEKSIYIGLESTLNEVLPQISNISETGCACCKKEFKTMIPQNSSHYFFMSHHFMTQYSRFINEFATKYTNPQDQADKEMEEFGKWYKEIMGKFKGTSHGYGRFDGDTYIFTASSTIE